MPQITSVTKLLEIGTAKLNEDQILVDEESATFGVFDGATPLTPYESKDGKTGAYIASNIVAETFREKGGMSLHDVTLVANSRLEEITQKASIDTSKVINRFCTTAAVARITDNAAELLCVGDSLIIVIKKDGNIELPLGYEDHDLDVMRHWRRLLDEGTDNPWPALVEEVNELRERSNETYGFINGDKRLTGFIRSKKLSLDGVKSILLLTDGMFLPKADPDTGADWEAHARLYEKNGLVGLYEEVRRIENTDPHTKMYPRYKVHDDAGGVAIDFKP